jgi:hypothetical protein
MDDDGWWWWWYKSSKWGGLIQNGRCHSKIMRMYPTDGNTQQIRRFGGRDTDPTLGILLTKTCRKLRIWGIPSGYLT